METRLLNPVVQERDIVNAAVLLGRGGGREEITTFSNSAFP
jgi:hypothetical protein